MANTGGHHNAADKLQSFYKSWLRKVGCGHVYVRMAEVFLSSKVGVSFCEPGSEASHRLQSRAWNCVRGPTELGVYSDGSA